MHGHLLRLAALLVALLLSAPAALQGQALPLDPGRLELSRADLERLAGELEGIAASSAYSGEMISRARRDLAAVRERLDIGDFHVGDRVVLGISGPTNSYDTLVVEPGPQVTIPPLGPISLRGVLRSELRPHMTRELERFLRNPTVQAESLIRISIQGMVRNPGFYVVPANILLSDALMVAGGPDRGGDLEKLRVERGGEILLEGDLLQNALVEGRTLDQLNLRAGDQLSLPEERQSILVEVARYGLIIGSTILLGIRVF